MPRQCWGALSQFFNNSTNQKLGFCTSVAHNFVNNIENGLNTSLIGFDSEKYLVFGLKGYVMQ